MCRLRPGLVQAQTHDQTWEQLPKSVGSVEMGALSVEMGELGVLGMLSWECWECLEC